MRRYLGRWRWGYIRGITYLMHRVIENACKPICEAGISRRGGEDAGSIELTTKAQRARRKKFKALIMHFLRVLRAFVVQISPASSALLREPSYRSCQSESITVAKAA